MLDVRMFNSKIDSVWFLGVIGILCSVYLNSQHNSELQLFFVRKEPMSRSVCYIPRPYTTTFC